MSDGRSFGVRNGSEGSDHHGTHGIVSRVPSAVVTTVPASLAVTQGVATPVSGISVADSNAVSGTPTVTVLVSDTNGLLAATTAGAGGGGLVIGSGTGQLLITGTLAQVNADLATLTYQAGPGVSDAISLKTMDTLGASDTHKLSVSVAPVPSVLVPKGTLSIQATQSTALSGISLFDPAAATSGNTVTATLTASSGLLSASIGARTGGGTITGSGTSTLTISGTLAQVNSDLRTLSYLLNAGASQDTVTVALSDIAHGNATQTVSVTAGPVVKAPSAVTVQQGNPTQIAGICVQDMTAASATETVTATLTDTAGLLSANTAVRGGGGTVTGSGSTSLTISGTLAQVNADLHTLYFQSSTLGSDNIAMAISTSAGGSTSTQTAMNVVSLPAGVPASLLAQYSAGFGESGESGLGSVFGSAPPPSQHVLAIGHH